jgi:hypothetical protein
MTNVAIAAANRPVYPKQVYHVSSPFVMTGRKAAYENEYSVGVRFPGIGLVSVVFLGMRQV